MDLHTLHIEHAVLLGVLSLLTLVNFTLHRRRRDAWWFTGFACSAFLGSVLIVARGVVPPPVSIVLGAGLFSIAYLCLHRALAGFYHLSPTTAMCWVQRSAVLLQIAALLFWGVIRPDAFWRLLVYSACLGVQTAATGLAILRQPESGPVRLPSRVMAGLLFALALNNVLRIVAILAHGVPAGYVGSTPWLSIAVLVMSVLQTAIFIAFVWMTAARLLEELEREATVDPLTGVLNRRAIESRAERELQRGQLHQESTAAILIDLDKFKDINDRWGHHSGDAVLRAVATRIDSQLRPGDVLARLGGDEFVVLLPRTRQHEALQLAEQMRGYLEELRCGTGLSATDEPIHVRASFGVAQCTVGCSWDELVRRCDHALYQAKDHGGNFVLSSSERR